MRAHDILDQFRTLETRALELSTQSVAPDLREVAKTYRARLDQLEAAHSRSWFGDHADTYFDELLPPPAGMSFDVEWGFQPAFHGTRNKGWVTYSREQLRQFVFREIGEEIFNAYIELSEPLERELSSLRDRSLDLLEPLNASHASKRLAKYADLIDSDSSPYTIADYINNRITAPHE